MEHYIVDNDKYRELLFSCDMRETETIIIIRNALTCFTNILLNDFTTAQSDKVSTTKIAIKISKLFLRKLCHYYIISRIYPLNLLLTLRSFSILLYV